MKKAGLALGILMVSFLVGTFGFYTALPYLQPERISGLTDSLRTHAVVDSLIQAHAAGANADSIRAVRAAALEIVGLTPDSLEQMRLNVHRVAALKDSLRAVRQQLAGTESRVDSLVAAMNSLQQRTQELEITDQSAEEISRAFTEINNDEMGEILEFVSPPVLRKLYEKASTKDRARILRALSPKKAALFLERLAGRPASIDSTDRGTAIASDSTALNPTQS